MISGPLPSARTADFVVSAHDDDLLVYDRLTDHVHHLNTTAAAIWRLCDGRRTVDAIAAESGADEETVWLALARLAEAGLLDTPQTANTGVASPSRRRFLRKAGIAAGSAVPVVVSMTAPAAAQIPSPAGQCWWLSINPGTWAPASEVAGRVLTYDECRERDGCHTGGACYKWTVNANDDFPGWP